MKSVVFAPPWQGGGVKSLYTACEGLDRLGCCGIVPFYEPRLAKWFHHECKLYDYSYRPDVVVYPEVYQPQIANSHHICFLLGKYSPPLPHTNLVVCRSDELALWLAEQEITMPTATIIPGINRKVFEYDGRPKENTICYMTRPHKHPEIGRLLRTRYGDRVIEIIDRSEVEVAEILRNSKVFVCRGNELEGSPRPPKEALVAGCVVVGLEEDLNSAFHTDFGVKCSSLDELIEKAGEALEMPTPTRAERDVVRDGEEEKGDWAALVAQIEPRHPVGAGG